MIFLQSRGHGSEIINYLYTKKKAHSFYKTIENSFLFLRSKLGFGF